MITWHTRTTDKTPPAPRRIDPVKRWGPFSWHSAPLGVTCYGLTLGKPWARFELRLNHHRSGNLFLKARFNRETLARYRIMKPRWLP